MESESPVCDAGACVTTDARGIIRDASAEAAAMLGMAREAMRGKLLIAFVARRDTRAFRGRLRALLAGEGTGTFSVQLRTRGGAPFPASLSFRVLREKQHARVCARWTISPAR